MSTVPPRLPKCAGGCAAKLGQSDLAELLKGIKFKRDKNLLVGPEHGSDAGVYKVSPTQTIVQSTDFFPPMVPDPYAFGRIAAANSISDIYAMGAKPVTVLNLLGAPKEIALSTLQAVLEGATEVISKSGAVVVGGHTVITKEILFGLAVTGLAHPKRFLRNTTAKAGDALVLTKPVGTGIYIHSFNAGIIDEEKLGEAVSSMSTLNQKPSEAALKSKASACTDITGFGLIAHLLDMLSTNGLSVRLSYSKIPKLIEAETLASAGHFPGGSKRNVDFTATRLSIASGTPEVARLLCNDAQTSGGLLIAIPQAKLQSLMKNIKNSGYSLPFNVIGEFVKPNKALSKGTVEVLP